MSRLTGDLSKVERKNDAIQNTFSKSSIKLEGTEYRQSKLDFKHTLVSSDKRNTQSTLDDYLLRSATLKASLVTVRKAIKSLPKLDTAESIKARAKLESELQTVTEDTAQLTSTIESRTGKIIEQEVVRQSETSYRRPRGANRSYQKNSIVEILTTI
jgi:predicted  nucleic acid-binding Zn-ribbon protein